MSPVERIVVRVLAEHELVDIEGVELDALTTRFWAKVDRTSPDSCWEWLAGRNEHGYGRFSVRGTLKQAHRIAYALVIAPVPPELDLDHLCRNRGCVNPRHLEPVERGENTRRGLAAAMLRNGTRCRKGLHPWPESAIQLSGDTVCGPCVHAKWDRLGERIPCPVCGELRTRGRMPKHQKRYHARAALDAITGSES